MKVKLSDKPHFSTCIQFVSYDEKTGIQDFQGNTGEITVRYQGSSTIVYCGIGEKKSCTMTIIRTAAVLAIKKCADLKREDISICSPKGLTLDGLSKAVVEGLVLGNYRFSKYKSEQPFKIKQIEIIDSDLTATSLKQILAICDSVLYTRDLVNDNASVVFPEYLAREARTFNSIQGFKATVLDEKDLKQQGLSLLAAVGQASSTPPRLALIEYTGNPKSKERIALIGKGITFDSGGQNHKPTGSIETMRTDMAGAATVLGCMKALVSLRPKTNIIGVIPAAHNAIGGNAYFPGDIYKSYSGKTVEIWSTDAEGRLVLADAISYCQKKYNPSCIIDLATLTGGILSALADFVAGLFSNDDTLAEKLFISGENTGERLWRFPLYQEYCDSIKGDLGDLRNVSKLKKGYASSLTGAAFIKEFIENNTAWAHLDIAGTAYNEGAAHGDVPQYATGFGVRLLIDFVLNHKGE